MRHRTTSRTVMASAGQIKSASLIGGVLYPNPNPHLSYPDLAVLTDTSKIIDEEPGFKSFGSCEHIRTNTYVQASGAPTNIQVRVASSSYSAKAVVWTCSGSALFGAALSSNSSTVPQQAASVAAAGAGRVTGVSSIDWGTLSYQAMDAMTQSVRTNFQIVNDILEVREMKRLLQPYRLFIREMRRNTAHTALRAFKRFRGHVVADIVSGSHLGFVFGIKPLTETCVGLTKLLVSFKDTLRRLRREAESIRTAHYSRPVDMVVLDQRQFVFRNTIPELSYLGTGASSYYETKWLKPPKYVATLRYQYDAQALSGALGSARLLLTLVGASNPLSILWEKIPYSFLVDWLVNVGDVLDSMGPDPVPFKVVDFCHSVKFAAATTLYVRFENGADPYQVVPVAFFDSQYYVRRREVPRTFLNSLATQLKLTGGKVAIAASLITQNRRRLA